MKNKKEVSVGFNFIDELKEIVADDDYRMLEKLFERVKEEISQEDLDHLIQSYGDCFDHRAEVMNSTIVEGEMESMTKGYIVVQYDLDYYLGCRDINHTDEETMSVDVSINERTGVITLTGEDLSVREPDDY